MKFNYKIWCKLFNVLSVWWYIKFYVFFVFFCCFTAAQSRIKRNICVMPITFFEGEDLERARHLLATWQDSRWRRIFAWSFLFQVFPHLCKEATRYIWVDWTFSKSKGKFFMEIILSSKYSWKRNRFSIVIVNICETRNEWLIRSYRLMSPMDMDWSSV